MSKNIIELKSINELPKDIKTCLEQKNLNIIFNDNSYFCVENFLSANSKIKDYYINSDSKIFIDLLEININLYFFLIDCIYDAYEIIENSYKVKILFGDNYEWIIAVCKNIMFNYPFTLDKTIFIPYDYINECFNNKNKIKLIETLIHEKIHISQRFNENIWEEYIQNQDSNWIKIKSDDFLNKMINKSIENENNILNKINQTFISNPDTWYENFKYIYKISDNYYYGQYVYNKKNKTISKKYYLINKNNYKLIECNEILDEEHPYEIYAYEISKKLIKK